MKLDLTDDTALKGFPVQAARRQMLDWFDRHKRPMPWRSSQPDPYHVLVSEAMLQQTQVATVIPYFNRFISTFATVHDLARADEQAVMKLWQGLGYYRRARNLQAAAIAIVERHDGQVPADVDALRALPGIGPYTAGAVASIGFGVQTPLVDGNVVRVLTRWFAMESSTDLPATQKQLWYLAGKLVPADRPGDFNQSLMELGATVCSTAAPKCLACPVAELCKAKSLGRQEDFPFRAAKKKPVQVVHDLVFIKHGQKYLFRKRPDDGLWAGLYQCPTIQHETGAGGNGQLTRKPPSQALAGSTNQTANQSLNKRPGKAQAAALIVSLESQGLPVKNPAWVGSFIHQTTHRTITFRIFEASLRSEFPVEDVASAAASGAKSVALNGDVWRTLRDTSDLPFSVAQTKAIALLTPDQPAA